MIQWIKVESFPKISANVVINDKLLSTNEVFKDLEITIDNINNNIDKNIVFYGNVDFYSLDKNNKAHLEHSINFDFLNSDFINSINLEDFANIQIKTNIKNIKKDSLIAIMKQTYQKVKS